MRKLLLKYGLCAALAVPIAAQAQTPFVKNTGLPIANNGIITVNGDWESDAGSTIRNNGSIITNASFVNLGTLDPSSSGGFIFNNAVATQFTPGGSTFGKLVKQGAGGLTLSGSVMIMDTLRLLGGVITLPTNADTLALRSATVLQVANNSYVDGLIARSGSGGFIFPLGKDGLYLPIRMTRATASRMTASVTAAPANVTIGGGVEAWINFPYVWNVSKKLASDTAVYVEINYPNTLPSVANPIVVRQAGNAAFTSMGARSITAVDGRNIIRSYSRASQGVFSVAQGFPGDFKVDSLALVALYNNTNGAAWSRRANWLSGFVDTWEGVTVNGQSITALNLAGNQLEGAVPDLLVDILALENIDLSGNAVTYVPDFSENPRITALNVSNNALDFRSLEPNAAVPNLNYLNQAPFGIEKIDTVNVGSQYTFAVDAGGTATTYQWKKGTTTIDGATNNNYVLASIDRSNMGNYIAEASNPLLPGLTIPSKTQRALASAKVGGSIFVDPNVIAQGGRMTLYRVTPGLFDVVATQPIVNGTFNFEKVVLDNYQILASPDTLIHEAALPTYYKNTIFWEEADTVFLENDFSDLTITTSKEPGASTGIGNINGFFEEDLPDDGSGGRIMRGRRISGAAVTARRVENAGRAKDEILTLVGYVFTNANGEFSLPNLPTGVYRLNIQFPGVPMDPNSFVTITIGNSLQSQVSVEARVVEGKINVRKLLITGFAIDEPYDLNVYPNPAADFIKLQFGKAASDRQAVMMDMTGKVLINQSASENDIAINVGHLSQGIYVLKVLEGGKLMKTLKVSIE